MPVVSVASKARKAAVLANSATAQAPLLGAKAVQGQVEEPFGLVALVGPC